VHEYESILIIFLIIDYFVSTYLTFKTGDNELSGEIPSEIGNLARLENFVAGKIATILYLTVLCMSLLFSNLLNGLFKQRRE